MRRARLVFVLCATAMLLTLAYRNVTVNGSSEDATWTMNMWSGVLTGRMASQHMVVQIGSSSEVRHRRRSTSTMGINVTTRKSGNGNPEMRWLERGRTALAFNQHALRTLSAVVPRQTTLHFTFGSAVMMDFVNNWLHFVSKAGMHPVLVGAADAPLLAACNQRRVPAAGIIPELDVWTYRRKPRSADLYEMKSEWKYFRHHNSDFLEMGLVKVAFLWELLSIGFNVLISDLDVVWLNGRWQRWMTWADAANPPVPQAALIAAADVLVTTDELDSQRDATGKVYSGNAVSSLTNAIAIASWIA